MTNFRSCGFCDRKYDHATAHCVVDHQPLVLIKTDQLVGRCADNRYTLVEVVGAGSTSTIYRGIHKSTGKQIALKIPHQANNAKALKRFQQEAVISASVVHPHLVQIYDCGIIDDRPYVAMEYLEGDNLQKIISNGRIDYKTAIPWFAGIAHALHSCHQSGVVHRGIKPAEIIVSNGVTKLVDFSLAKLMPWSGRQSMHLTRTGEMLGVALYASPEQIKSQGINQSTDIYSLGVTLYEALTGRPPFLGNSLYEIAEQHIHQTVPQMRNLDPPVVVPEILEQVLKSMLEKDRNKRPESMLRVLEVLKEVYKLNSRLNQHLPVDLLNST